MAFHWPSEDSPNHSVTGKKHRSKNQVFQQEAAIITVATHTVYENIMQTQKKRCGSPHGEAQMMQGCKDSDMGLQGHFQCLSNILSLGRSGHTTVLASPGPWKCRTPQQCSQELAPSGSARTWLTSLGLGAGMFPDRGMGF